MQGRPVGDLGDKSPPPPPPSSRVDEIFAFFWVSIRLSEGGNCKKFRDWRHILVKAKNIRVLPRARAKNSRFLMRNSH